MYYCFNHNKKNYMYTDDGKLFLCTHIEMCIISTNTIFFMSVLKCKKFLK